MGGSEREIRRGVAEKGGSAGGSSRGGAVPVKKKGG
jgi:hypothetical protein